MNDKPIVRRLYLMSESSEGMTSDYESTPPDLELFTKGERLGRYSVSIGDTGFVRNYGLPGLNQTPILTFGITSPPRDMLGMSIIYSFVSNRAKSVIESVAPGSFEFAECKTIVNKGPADTPYWMMAIKRCEDWDPKDGSNIEWMRDSDPSQARNPYIRMINELRLDAIPDELHAFQLARYKSATIVDEQFVDAVNAAGLTGFQFSPLQEPTQDEWSELISFKNFGHWYAIKKEREQNA